MENITIPNSVKSIDTGAFAGCYKLKEIKIPDSVKSIGNGVFLNCINLSQVNIPNGIKKIPGYNYAQGYADETVAVGCFHNCRSIKKITIPSTVSTITKGAFDGCTGLSSVFIGSGVEDADGLLDCTNLTSITVDEKNKKYSSSDGILFNKDKTDIVIYPRGRKGIYSLPKKVTVISDSAFENCTGLTSVTIPNSVTKIGYGAFEDCIGLTSVAIPNNVTKIEDYAFDNCIGLTSITIPNSVTSIESGAFENCTGLTSVTIPNSVISIGSDAFKNCTGLKKIEVSPNNNYYSSYDGVLLDKDGYNLILCPEGKSGNFVVPDSVGCINDYAFNNCVNLTNIQIGENVNEIKGYAFENCKRLEKFVLPKNVDTIGYYGGWYEPIFTGCTNLKVIDVDRDNYYYSSVDGVLFDKEKEKLITCPAKKSGQYTVPKSVKSVTEYAFDDCNSLESIILPESMPDFSYYELEYCSNLKSIRVMGNNAHYSTEDGVLFNKDKSEIYVFPRNKGGNYTIPDSVTSIEGSAFKNCTGLISITIPNRVTSIEYDAFYGCTRLESIKVSDDNKYYSSYKGALFNKDKTEILCCPKSKKEFDIPNGVTSIGSGVFDDCTNLTNVTVPNSVKSIFGSFNSCTSLTSIIIPESVTYVDDNDFYNCGNNFTIYGYEGTAAELLALRCNLNFVRLQTVPVSVSLNKTSLSLGIGKTYTLTKKVLPSNAVTSYTWSSSNTKVATVNSIGKVTAINTGKTTITVKTSNGKTSTCIITVPKNLAAPSVSSLTNTANGIKISWKKVSGTYGYRVYVKTLSGWKKLKDTTATSFTDSAVAVNKTKTYTIRCIDKSGETISNYNTKGWSKKYTATAPKITKLKSTSKGVSVTWNKVAGVYGYRVYRKYAGGSWTKVKDTAATSLTDSGAKKGKKVTYTVRCIDKKNKSVSGYNSKGWSITRK